MSNENYSILRNQEKPTTKVEVEKIAPVKEVIEDILKKNAVFWKEAKQDQQGVERSILLNKVSAQILINSNVFDAAIWELETEQKVIPYESEGKYRYVLFVLPSSD